MLACGEASQRLAIRSDQRPRTEDASVLRTIRGATSRTAREGFAIRRYGSVYGSGLRCGVTTMHPVAKEFLVGLAKLGARATAAAVDVALEEAQTLVGEVQTRLSNGRQKAQSIGKRPRAGVGKVKVSVSKPQQTDFRGVEVDAEVVEGEGQ
jgi:hypothetical protein